MYEVVLASGGEDVSGIELDEVGNLADLVVKRSAVMVYTPVAIEGGGGLYCGTGLVELAETRRELHSNRSFGWSSFSIVVATRPSLEFCFCEVWSVTASCVAHSCRTSSDSLLFEQAPPTTNVSIAGHCYSDGDLVPLRLHLNLSAGGRRLINVMIIHGSEV